MSDCLQCCLWAPRFFAIGIRTGVWTANYWLCIPVLVAHFAVFYSFSALLAVMSRNTTVCIVGSIVFWAFCWGMNYGRHALAGVQVDDIQRAVGGLGRIADIAYRIMPKPADFSLVLADALGADPTAGGWPAVSSCSRSRAVLPACFHFEFVGVRRGHPRPCRFRIRSRRILRVTSKEPIPDWSAARAAMMLDPTVVNLNTGSYGPTPRAVFDRVTELRRHLAAEPMDFLLREMPPLCGRPANASPNLSAHGRRALVFTANVTAAINIVANGSRLDGAGRNLDERPRNTARCNGAGNGQRTRQGLTVRYFKLPLMPTSRDRNCRCGR